MSDMDLDRQDRIRRRAYQIWQDAGSPEGVALDHWAAAEKAEAERDAMAETASADSFPASDPPANTGITGPTNPS